MDNVVKEVVKDTTAKLEDSVKNFTSTIGKVINCSTLSVRMQPSKEAGILLVLGKGSVVKFKHDLSNEEYFAIIIESGTVGYCKKEFIKPL